jgi:hypothetical protein
MQIGADLRHRVFEGSLKCAVEACSPQIVGLRSAVNSGGARTSQSSTLTNGAMPRPCCDQSWWSRDCAVSALWRSPVGARKVAKINACPQHAAGPLEVAKLVGGLIAQRFFGALAQRWRDCSLASARGSVADLHFCLVKPQGHKGLELLLGLSSLIAGFRR